MPYQHADAEGGIRRHRHPGRVLPEDERVWVPQAPNVWFRPLCLNASQGYWVNLLKVTRAGVLSRHRHTNPVHGYVLKGRWHYLEHDWVATEGGYVYEPPGETHTLVVPEDVAGDDHALPGQRADALRRPLGARARLRGRLHQDRHVPPAYEAVGLGADYVEQFIR